MPQLGLLRGSMLFATRPIAVYNTSMSIRKITVEVDEGLYNINDDSTLSVRVVKGDETLSHETMSRYLEPEEVADNFDYAARETLNDKTLSLRKRREKYDLYMEAASQVPGLRK